MTHRKTLLGTMLLCAVALAEAAPGTVFVNGKVWIGDGDANFAQAFAVEGERISAVGGTAKIQALADGKTKVVDLHGKLVVPGFIDNHTHFQSALSSSAQWTCGMRQLQRNSRGASSRVPRSDRANGSCRALGS